MNTQPIRLRYTVNGHITRRQYPPEREGEALERARALEENGIPVMIKRGKEAWKAFSAMAHPLRGRKPSLRPRRVALSASISAVTLAKLHAHCLPGERVGAALDRLIL